MKGSKTTFVRLITVSLLAVAAAAFLAACKPSALSYEAAVRRLDEQMRGVNWRDNFSRGRAPIVSTEGVSIADALPKIDFYPVTVEPQPEAGSVVVEIFSSTEKAGKGTDGWIVEAGQQFNRDGIRIAGGSRAQVRIRSIPSGTAYEYIAYRKYRPDGFTPSNHLWIQMVRAAGVQLTPVAERLVGNIAGIVMKNEVAKGIEKKYGALDIKSVIDAVVQGSLAMGYTNPFASSTGLNFLVTVLGTFAGGNEAAMLSPDVVSAFEAFQRGVPFVSLTTMQMRDSVEKDGSLDAFVMEYQTFVNTKSLASGYQFMPFGYLHDNPLYAVETPGKEKTEALKLFADYVLSSRVQSSAERYGFNALPSYRYAYPYPAGALLVEAQKLWKQKKDSGDPVVAVFLSDVSGSMAGVRLNMLKDALVKGSAFIAPANYIGLATFEATVSRVLPVEQFSEGQKTQFIAAVKEMKASGNTAMYDGIMVALRMLVDARKKVPNGKPTLFVLTDGETNAGYSFDRVKDVIEGLKIPVYTISYGDDITQLRALSTLNEAASLKAGTDDIAYQIGSLLNAEM